MGLFGKLFGEKHKLGRVRAALSICPSGVRGLLFSAPGKTLAVHVAAYIPALFSHHVSGALVINVGGLEKLIYQLLEKNPVFATADVLYVGLSGEFLRSSIFRAVFERENPGEKVERTEFKNLLEKAERASRENLAEHLMRQSGRGTELRLLNSRLEEILIDGYAVADPVGFSGKEIEIALFNLYADEPYVEFLQNIKRLFGSKKMFPHASSYAVARAYVRASPSPFSGIFVEIGEAMTSISVVSKNAFLGTKPFSIGAHLFTRSMAANVHLGAAQAEEIKGQYRSGKLSAPVNRKISGTLKRASTVWGSGVELALEEFAGTLELFPSSFFLYGADASLPDLARTLEEPERFSGIPFLEKRSYTVLAPDVLPFASVYAAADPGKTLAESDIVTLSLAYLSLENPNENLELTRIVERATKLAYS